MTAPIDIGELRTRAADSGRRPAGARPATATLALGPDWANLPEVGELAALLPRVPVAEVRMAESADFSALPDRTIVRIIALIRECSSIGARVAWSLILGAEQLDLIQQLDHLPAPDETTVLGSGVSPEWRSAGGFGRFYFRRGPNFLSVVDRRSGRTDWTVLDDPVAIDVFSRALAGCSWAEVSGDQRHAAAAGDLLRRSLIMRVGDHCVTLPVHMRSWPVGTVLLGGTLASAGSKDAPERV